MEIIHSPNGTWGFRTVVGLDPATGKRKRVSRFGFQRRKDAEAALREIQESIKKQQYVPGSNVTFEDFAADWLKIYSQQVKISTVRIRQHNIAWLNRRFAKIPLQRITKRDYQMFLLDLKEQLQPNTICGVHATAKMIFKKAREFELIYNDPTEFAAPPRPSRKTWTRKTTCRNTLKKLTCNAFSTNPGGTPNTVIIRRFLCCLLIRGSVSVKPLPSPGKI